MRTRSPSRRAGAGQRLVDARACCSRCVGVVEGLEVGEVGQGHGPLGLAAHARGSCRRRPRSTRKPSATGRWTTKPSAHRLGVPGRGAPASASRPTSSAQPSPVTAEMRQIDRRRRRRPRSPRSASGGHVGPGADHEPGPVEQVGPVAAQLVRAGSAPARRAPARRPRGQVDQHGQHPGPLDVAQELVAEAAALAGPLDEAGDVGHDELAPSSRRTTPRLGSRVVNG